MPMPGWSLMRNDKEGGWTILSNDAMRALTDEVLGGGNYCVVEPPVVNEIRAGSLRLAKRIVSFEEDPRWMKAVCKGWRSSSICASLKLLLKSHKDEGDVKCRAVHAAPVYSLEGLSRWADAENSRKVEESAPLNSCFEAGRPAN